MSVKTKTVYVCRECGASQPKWAGQCSECQAWNSFDETLLSKNPPRAAASWPGGSVDAPSIQTIDAIEADPVQRFNTGIAELDRVLGGGVVPGSVVLLGGDPGIGKSTLLLQALHQLGGQVPALYVSGEESVRQIALRAQRLGIGDSSLPLMAENRLEFIMRSIAEMQPRLVVIDSVQTLATEHLPSAPGSVAQVRETAQQLVRFAKQTGTAVILVGHVTKEGAIAGPRILEHMVDAVLYFEGDSGSRFRLIRAVKNRFGAVNEIGVFAMADNGLREVSNPSAMFAGQRGEPAPGSAILATLEGTRPLLVEVQALVDQSGAPQSRRLTVGLDQNRLAMLLAVLHQSGGVALYDHDVFVNVVGGIRVIEPAADLAVALAVVSSFRQRPLPKNTIVFGEIGLTGEVRPVQRGEDRLHEAAKIGYECAILPKANAPKRASRSVKPGMRLVIVERIAQALDELD